MIGFDNKTLFGKYCKIKIKEFFDFVDKVYPENEEPIPGKEFFDSVDKNYLEDKGYIPDFAEELYEKLVDDDGDEKTEKERLFRLWWYKSQGKAENELTNFYFSEVKDWKADLKNFAAVW